ncbi:MAG: precorrin-6y C5,15-methyltransferase (decarboxylating) subunit CbiE [Devosia sp.]|nr:precorrin-6y C5,15-methyltransferase (decarboxylating) subunit CbiE [Devosia sp.]
MARDGDGVLDGRHSLPALIPWQSPLSAMLDQVKARRGRPTAIVATGDPMWFGIGATLSKHLDPDEFEVLPAVSALQLAASRLKWPLQHVATISLHGRPVETIHPHILPGNRVIALTTDGGTMTAVAALLVARGFGRSRLTVLDNLGATGERLTVLRAADAEPGIAGDFCVLAVECIADPAASLLPPLPGLPDDAFVSDGQLTKREVRAATAAKLAPFPGALLWDVGAGCGSVGIEWLRAARDARAVAFERDPLRCEMIAANATALGTPSLEIVSGDAPASLTGRPVPDAIFLGGDVGNAALFEACWQALRSGGRLVANAVTLDAEVALYERQERLGGELARLDVGVLDWVGGHRVMRPRLAVTQWLAVKP